MMMIMIMTTVGF